MKKRRIFSVLLLPALLAQLTLLPALAEPDASDAVQDSTASEPSDVQPSSEPASEPVETVSVTPPPALLDYAVQTDYTVKAKAAALIDLDGNALVYSQDIDKQVYPASLTKIMTCMIALDRGKLDDVLTVSSAALQDLAIGGSTANLKQGEMLTLEELLYCVMVSSANEACNVVAEYVSGSIPAFVALMNEYAAKLGMSSTHFANTHGLHEDDHYTTVRDLSVLARWAWQNEKFREIASTTVHTVPQTNVSEPRELHTTDYLISGLTVGKYYYDKAIGGKTGFTSWAGGCLVSFAEDGSTHFLSIVCGCETVTDEDGTQTDERFTETKRLFEYGFSHYSYVQVLSDTTMLDMPEVLYAQGRGNVVVRAGKNISVLLPDDCDLSEIEMQIKYLSDSPLEAPLEAGQVVGTVTAVYHGSPIASCDLVTLTAVQRSTPKYVEDKTNEAVHGFFSKLMGYWYLVIPLLLVLLFAVILLIFRAINVHKAKKRRARRAARRKPNE